MAGAGNSCEFHTIPLKTNNFNSMKYFISSIFFLLIFTGIINAREKSVSLNINTQFSFFKDKYSDNSFIPINPGGEILYELGLNNKLTLSSGINYSFSIWKHSVGAKSTFKRLAHEIYFPVLIKLKLNQKFFTEFGIYPGWLIKGKELYINNIDITKGMDGAYWHSWEGLVYPGSLNGSNFEASFVPNVLGPPYYGSGNIMVKGENTCGSSLPVAAGYGPCGYTTMSFTPNPSINDTTLSIESTSETLKSASGIEKGFDDNTEWELEIYNPDQSLKEKKTKLKGNSTTIQTSGWMEGVYSVRVKYKDKILTGKLIVKKQ